VLIFINNIILYTHTHTKLNPIQLKFKLKKQNIYFLNFYRTTINKINL
jgi:hypothetical protein